MAIKAQRSSDAAPRRAYWADRDADDVLAVDDAFDLADGTLFAADEALAAEDNAA